MLKTINTILFIASSLIGYSQIPLKIDYTSDVFMKCDSVVLYDYGSISPEDWDSLSTDSTYDQPQKEKQVLYYKDGVLNLEENYSKEAEKWVLNSKVTYEIDERNVIEAVSSAFGSFSESYNLDYIWITKLRPIDILPTDEAFSVLSDPKIKEKYHKEIKNIVDGSIVTSEDRAGDSVRTFKDVNGKIIREEKITTTDNEIKVIANNYLKKETSKEFVYTKSGNIKSKRGTK